MKIKTRRYYFYYLLRVGAFIVGFLPMRVASRLAGLVAGTGFYILSPVAQDMCSQLSECFPEKSHGEIRGIAKKVFMNIACNYTELLFISRFSKERLNRVISEEGFDNLKKALSYGKGAIVLTAHLGNWELVGEYILLNGLYGKTIVKRLYFEKYENLIRGIRQRYGLGMIYRDGSPKEIFRLLRSNHIVGILADQDIDSIEGVFVDFFGKPAYTPIAPVKIARATGAPLVPFYVVRKENGYKCIAEKPIFVEQKGTDEETVKYYTQEWSSILESYIRKYPDQWVWMHKRWKTKKES